MPVVRRSMSISQIRRLGDRLRHAAQPSVEDLELLQRLRLEYDAPLQIVERTLRDELQMHATSRLKTVQTIIEKLVRERTRLSSMEDIAGARIVEEMTLAEQDERVARIVAAFPSARLRDRRAMPSHGYRAVHVIAFVGDFPVEIQVRTHLQDLWAQSTEALAVLWGRQIQYGEPPERAGDGIVGADDPFGPTRREVIDLLRSLSATIAEVEAIGQPDATEMVGLRRVLERFVRVFRRTV